MNGLDVEINWASIWACKSHLSPRK